MVHDECNMFIFCLLLCHLKRSFIGLNFHQRHGLFVLPQTNMQNGNIIGAGESGQMDGLLQGHQPHSTEA